jgi:hypothetical protein
VFGPALSEPLSEEYQQDLLDQLLHLKGQGPLPLSLEEAGMIKCGTPLLFQFLIHRDNFTGKYAVQAKALQARPVLAYYYDSPGGRFRVHYDTTGNPRVYQPEIDTIPSGGDGIPDYVNKVAEISDSVWTFIISQLGYPPPPSDGTAGGGLDLVDVYIDSIPDIYYGYTEWEDSAGPLSKTSYIVIDNDYSGIPPYNQSPEMNRRLDAARVTLAHEFFHTIHYGMDFTEYEVQGSYGALYWWEMSAVWMEEMMYDDINDYYAYLERYYDYPWIGLQAVPFTNPLHQYASCVFPIYLSERFDTVLIRDIWERCRDYGIGPHFPLATNDAVYEFSDSLYQLYGDPQSPDYDSLSRDSIIYDLGTAFREFAVWNYFTGILASLAPDGFSFSEADNFPRIPDSACLTFNEYIVYNLPWVEGGDGWPDTLPSGEPIVLNGIPLTYYEDRMPQNLAAHYLKMKNLNLIDDPLFVFDIFGLNYSDYDITWNFSFIKIPINPPMDPVEVNMYKKESPGQGIRCSVLTDQSQSLIAIPTPSSTNYLSYYLKRDGYGYSPAFLDTSLVKPNIYFVHGPPYPNPIVVSSPDDCVTFRANTNSPAPGKWVKLEVSIFNIAGEKLNRVDSDGAILDLGNDPPCEAKWCLENRQGKAVAPGVYLAYCELRFADGSPPVTDKFKIAVIR